MLVLTSLSFSPWSEKARWALDHHQLVYERDNYVLPFGEIKLRARMRKLRGRITVPVLYDGQTWYTDSFDIARAADRLGSGASLFPADKLSEITEWNWRSERALAAGRAQLMLAMADDPEFALAFLPPFVPAALRPRLRPLAQKGIQIFIAKYRMRDEAPLHESVLLEELDRLAAALSARQYLVGDSLTYADLAMAPVLQGISPVDARYMAALPGTRKNSVTTSLQHRYGQLIAWRDELYARHRLPQKT